MIVSLRHAMQPASTFAAPTSADATAVVKRVLESTRILSVPAKLSL